MCFKFLGMGCKLSSFSSKGHLTPSFFGVWNAQSAVPRRGQDIILRIQKVNVMLFFCKKQRVISNRLKHKKNKCIATIEAVRMLKMRVDMLANKEGVKMFAVTSFQI